MKRSKGRKGKDLKEFKWKDLKEWKVRISRKEEKGYTGRKGEDLRKERRRYAEKNGRI